MTQDSHDKDYLGLFKPKTGTPDPSTGSGYRRGATQPTEYPVEAVEPGQSSGDVLSSDGEPWESVSPVGQTDVRDAGAESNEAAGVNAEFEPLSATSDRSGRNSRTGHGQSIRMVGMALSGGCLLLLLLAVVMFAFVQVFVRRGGDDGGKETPVVSPTSTAAAVSTPSSTSVPITKSPLIVPLVSSDDVRVPVALPERLTIGDTDLMVDAVRSPAGTWPAVPTAGDTATWAYGTVINYIFGLAPTQENIDLLSALQVGDALCLQMSTGLVLNFNIDEMTTGAADETLFEQSSPRLTLALLTDDPAQRAVVSAAFFSDEAGESSLLSDAAIGLVDTPVDQGPVRVTVIEVYHATAEQAGLPPDTGYLLIDVRVENIGAAVLEPEFFQTFVSDAAGGRYPLTMLAEQFAHHGMPSKSLAPGETVIGSLGYLVPRPGAGAADQMRWVFNPLPGSDNWVAVPVPYDLPPPAPTSEPPPSAGFAVVTVSTDDVFVDQRDDLLDIGLEIENVSEGVVQVTEDDVSLSSWTDGELALVSPAPPLPWTLESGESRFFQLQFQLPSTDSALLTVLGYTFSIENLGGE